MGNLIMNTSGTFVRTQQPNQFAAGTVVDLTTAWGYWNRLELLGNYANFGRHQHRIARGPGWRRDPEWRNGQRRHANATLTLNGNGTYLFAGHLRDYDDVSGHTLGLIKTGSGTQTLSATRSPTPAPPP